MKLNTLKEINNCKVIFESSEFETIEVDNCVAGDLMSEVLVADGDSILMITSLNADQVIHTAHMVDAVAVLLVNGKKPSDVMIELAEKFDIALLSTELSLFKMCREIND